MNAVLRLVTLSALMAPVLGCVDQRSLNPASGALPQWSNPTDNAPITPASPQQDGLPRVVMPVTGEGIPVVAIPLGGMIYAPVTGGPPVLAVPLSP
jgi:hypothetical protein